MAGPASYCVCFCPGGQGFEMEVTHISDPPPPGVLWRDTRTAQLLTPLRSVERCILRNMPKAHKEKRNKRSRHNGDPAEYRLLTYAALGQKRKVAKLFDRHAELDVNFYDAHGYTALHQVNVNDST